ncbi:MAG: 3-methyl-2-oxobutanoate hydroxymethyltransferase [Candidatus Pelagibacter sp. TMED196]|nr:MAG: 3-methyl-2-oxobutanoate hydroxymethyltransferase [Candidatus Pelagibacter sp. TMED196]|tara:strand:+ start:1758 stop:2534 length:777 start_codon:yes stop_codon:yes gene_type:complete
MLKKINRIKGLKLKRKLVCLTAYSTPISKLLDNHCDIVLVGDSMATAFYGMENTKSINLKTIINHAVAVKKGSKKSTVVVDMPINTYKNLKIAKKNVKEVFRKTKCDAIKLESDGKNFNIIRKLVNLGFPVMGHIGFTPQNKNKFKPQGLKKNEENKLIKESLEIERAGAFSIVLECIGEKTSKKITNIINIPTIGIGSSKFCDGQILVTDDLIGISGFKPKFVKKYINLKKILEKIFNKFKMDVLKERFPTKKNSFN